jgi:hypothetical protein
MPVRVSCDLAHTLYANAFNITGADGEIAMLLGLNPGLLAGQQETTIRFSDCVFLSPATARRLVEALTRVLAEHDSRQTSQPPPPRASQSAGAGDILSVGQPATASAMLAAGGSQADLLVKLADGLQTSYGFERSFRICPGSLQGRRFLLSLHRESLGEQGRPRPAPSGTCPAAFTRQARC